MDVVTTEGQQWAHPPFEGHIEDGYVWGRGALDMKGGLAMMISALLRARRDGLRPPGDVIFAGVADEENLGTFGSKFLVEKHAEQFAGVHYALGEFGGFSFYFGPRRYYPIMVAEKQGCWMKATVRGSAGHGSLPIKSGAMVKMAEMLKRLDHRRLPVHITPPVREMVDAAAASLPAPLGFGLRLMLYPFLTDLILDLIGEPVRVFEPLFHNTASATMLGASDKINVIPAQVSAGLDGRLLPGFSPEDIVQELHQILGREVEIEVMVYEPGPVGFDMGFFETLAGVLRESDPQGIPVPFLLSGVTDARFFSRLGIQTYGFLPMKLPRGFKFSETVHAANERIPVEALDFGSDVIFKAMQRTRSQHP
jgi:acetylornithine deacetylase/succinyl-diaminopimelate desuccinylase-like protein